MSVPTILAKSIARLMVEDDRRCLLGEDVVSGGMLGWSRIAAGDENLRRRLFAAPLTNAAHVAHAGGLALAGLWPIVLLPSSTALLEALPALRELGRLPWRSAGTRSLPLLFVAPDGPGWGLGGDGAESVETTLAHVPGLEVWTAGRPEDLAGAVRGAADFSHEAPGQPASPRVLLLPRRVLVADTADVERETVARRGATATHRHGDRATVFAWGDSLAAALAAADACAECEPSIAVTVVELAQLAPIDPAIEAMIAAARSTGKLIIAHSGPRNFGLGAELAAQFADHAILQLDAPIRRLTGDSALLAGHEEHRGSPSAASIVEAIVDVVHY